jgi:ATP-dependent DNA helicase RecG
MAASMGEASAQRLAILCESNDGFRIAEEDLRIRGPGELLGTRQHGLPAFKVVDLAKDLDLLIQARDDACSILDRDPALALAPNATLRSALQARSVTAGGLPSNPLLIDVA